MGRHDRLGVYIKGGGRGWLLVVLGVNSPKNNIGCATASPKMIGIAVRDYNCP